MPVLALLAEDEQVINLPRARQMLAYLPDCRQISFANARHELLNELPETTRRLFDELSRFLSEIKTLPDYLKQP